MPYFPKKTMLAVGFIAAVTTLGVYSATAGMGGAIERPLQSDTRPSVEAKGNRVIRIVGPQFLPDNGSIKLWGAAAERAKRGQG